MADAPEIKVKLTAEDTGVSAAIKELGSQLKNLKKQQEDTAGSSLKLSSAFNAIASAAALIGLTRLGKEAFDSAVNIGKMAEKTGLTTQTLSVFHHVADEVGVSTDVVDKALIRGAKSITEFQLGSAAAAKGFALLGITQKQLIGLKPDKAIELVTTALGRMAPSLQRTAAAQLIFSRSGAELIPVASAIAGEGFDKITASASKLGLLLDQDTVDAFRSAKASMQELEDAGKGVATQFEAGLLPAISDVLDAVLESVDVGSKSGEGFQEMGKVAGAVVRGIAAGFIFMGTSIAAEIEATKLIFSEQFDEIKIRGISVYEALGAAAKGHFDEARKIFSDGTRDIGRDQETLASQQKAVWDDAAVHLRTSMENLFPSDAEEARRQKERVSRLRPDKTDDRQIPAAAPPSDAAEKAALALLEKQLQDELTIHRAYAKQTEQVDKEMYDAGEISLAEYFDRRRVAVKADTDEEVAILQQGLVAAQAVVQKAAVAKSQAATPKDADKQEAARLQALQKVDELQTKISELQISSSTKIHALETEQFKEQNDQNQKILEFHKLIDESQGKGIEVAKQEIAMETQKLAIILRQAGESEAQVQAELAKYAALKTAQATFDEQQKAGAAALKDIEDQKAAIEDRVKNGQLFQVQADQQIRDLETSRLPALQAIAQQLVEQAKLTGDIAKIQAAEDFQKQVGQLATASNQVGQQVAQLKQNVQQSLTSGFANLFTSLVSGTQSVGQAFRSLASSVISSLAQMMAQMLAQMIMMKLFKSVLGGFSGGGSVGGGGGGHAEGGLIRGPGGPKSDSIPARVSAGEYIVKADAVSAFGVHNLEAINRGLKVPSLERLSLPKFAEGGLVGNAGGGGGDSNINLGIGLDEGLILRHLSSKAAGRIVLQHLVNNPKAASKALSRSD